MSDLIERLRHAEDPDNYVSAGDLWNLCGEAADDIERIRAENKRLREALELILSARAREFGIDYVEGCARAALSQSTESV